MDYRGKHVASVNYDNFLQEAPRFNPREKLKRSGSPLFYSRSFREHIPTFPTVAGAFRPSSAITWVKGKNEFDRQLQSHRRYHSLLENRRNVDKLRHVLSTKAATLSSKEAQEAHESTVALLSTRSNSVVTTLGPLSSCNTTFNSDTSTFSTPQRLKSVDSIVADLTIIREAAECQSSSRQLRSNTNGSLCSEGCTGLTHLPTFCVCHGCLFVNSRANRRTEQTFVDRFTSSGLPAEIPMGHDNSFTQMMGNKCGSRHIDERLLTLLRARDVSAWRNLKTKKGGKEATAWPTQWGSFWFHLVWDEGSCAWHTATKITTIRIKNVGEIQAHVYIYVVLAPSFSLFLYASPYIY